MANLSAPTFLDAAEVVLREHGRPMTSDDIVRSALERGELSSRGATPETAMRARLATDIVRLGQSSRFQRTAPNRFSLREWERGIPEVTSADVETLACIASELLEGFDDKFGFLDEFEALQRILSQPGQITFIPRPAAETTLTHKQLVAYVMLEDRHGRILSYQRGAYSTTTRYLHGAHCIGFGGHVAIDDAHSLFGRQDAGVTECAHREVYEELGGLRVSNLRPLGFIADNSSPMGRRHLGVVLAGSLPDTFNLAAQRHERGIARLALNSPETLWSRFDTFEFWSQLLIRRFHARPSTIPKVVVRASKQAKRKNRQQVCIVGEIAVGKTEAAEYLATKFHIPAISTRGCVASLIGQSDFGTSSRTEFQTAAAAFIQQPGGLEKLVEEIHTQVKAHAETRVLIDGVRNVQTLDLLRKVLPELHVLYLDAPRDRAFEFFCARSRRRGSREALREFREVRSHPVEREVPLLKYRADTTLFNDGTLPELYAALDKWWS